MTMELEKLREYKKLTKLRMKQAAEKLATYRVQLEEATKTIATHEATIAQQANLISELRLEVVKLKEKKAIEGNNVVQACVDDVPLKEVLKENSSSTDSSEESGSESSLMESSSDEEEKEVPAKTSWEDMPAVKSSLDAVKYTVVEDAEPSTKKQKTQDTSSELNLFLKDARNINGSKKQKAEKGFRSFYNIIRDSNDKTRTTDVLLPKLITFLKKTHDIPLSIILPAFVLIAIPSFDVLIHVQVLNAIATNQDDVRMTLAFISRHIARKNKLPIKIQVGWCRIHTLLSKQHDAIASTNTFIVDRLLAPNRHILDFVALSECWPQVFSSMHPNNCSSILAATARYMIGILMEMREAEDALDVQIEPIDQMYALCGGNLTADHEFLLSAFNSIQESSIFDYCQSVRILVTALDWAQCQEKFPILGEIITKPAVPTANAHLLLAGVVASIFIQTTDDNGTVFINTAKEIMQRITATLQDANSDENIKTTAAIALLDVVSHISVKSLAKEYLHPLLKWFGSQTPKEQLAFENVFLRKLQQTVISLV
ncbi:hypothetical protein THRCLA_03337 [Thraustotheca clavata]|uniref:Uncharacterized protein n=1 Tax=Thraustotheca clavata TaxID=74557 RepID=A0A1W0A2D0_9STRA|nr:hypothetical protein THRCLA_03337 [Thraustotheca clavata]